MPHVSTARTCSVEDWVAKLVLLPCLHHTCINFNCTLTLSLLRSAAGAAIKGHMAMSLCRLGGGSPWSLAACHLALEQCTSLAVRPALGAPPDKMAPRLLLTDDDEMLEQVNLRPSLDIAMLQASSTQKRPLQKSKSID